MTWNVKYNLANMRINNIGYIIPTYKQINRGWQSCLLHLRCNNFKTHCNSLFIIEILGKWELLKKHETHTQSMRYHMYETKSYLYHMDTPQNYRMLLKCSVVLFEKKCIFASYTKTSLISLYIINVWHNIIIHLFKSIIQ